jgi:hypothetical protein
MEQPTAVVREAATAATLFPLSNSPNARYLQDRDGNPFPIMGRTAWFLTSLSSADQQLFLDDTQARGFNTVEFHVINHDPRGNHPPFDGAGNAPFLKRLDGSAWSGGLGGVAPDFTTPNPAYWNAIDSLIASAAQRQLLLMMFPAYVGYPGSSDGWQPELVSNGATRVQSYGAFVANRYKDYGNIVWMMGGDDGNYDGAEGVVQQALRNGVDSVAGQSKYYSAEWASEMIGTDIQAFGPITLNGIYSFTGKEASLGRRAYSYTPVEPAFLLEEPFDQEGPDGNGVNPNATQPVRRFQYWGWLSTIGGYVAGNGYIWRFAGDWKSHLDTQGSRDMAKLNAFIRSISWQKLVPSGLAGMKTLITSGGGASPDAADYVAAAATPDGKLLVAYAPPARQSSFSVDMSAMSGSTRARWFNPASGAYTEIATGLAPSGSRAFSVPGDNGAGYSDWVLVLDVATASSAAPTVATAAAASPAAVTSTTTNVSVRGADDGGESSLTYSWSATGPATVTFSPNASHAAASATATFSKAGSYVLRATISDAEGQTVTSDVSVSVGQSLTSLAVSPGTATVSPGGRQTFSATARDQFGAPLTQQPTTSWTVSGGGTIDASGVFSAGSSTGGPFTVTGTASGKSGTASVTVSTLGTALYRINAGGGASAPFTNDQYWSGGNTYSSGNAVSTNGVAGAAPAAVYQSERYGNHSYSFTGLSSGAAFVVRLHFAEIYFTSAGSRIFNVSINGTQVLSNFDIYAVVGNNQALVRDFNTNADSSGRVVIQLTGVKDNAKLSALELYSVGGGEPPPPPPPTTTFRINAGGGATGSFVQDSLFSGGTGFSTTTTITTSGASNPAPAGAYQSERYGNFTYNFTGLTAGSAYLVRLHFAEIYFTSAGSRLFDVRLNGTTALSSFDVFSAAGGANRALVREFSVNADGAGQLAVQFVSVRDSAKVSAIEVLPR